MARSSAVERQAQIIDAALELFRRKGFAAVSTRDLAEHAGLSRSHIYHYFSDWNTLRRAAFEHFADSQLAEANALLEVLPPREALELFLRECLPVRSDAGWALWLDAWDESMHDPELARAYLSVMARWQALLTGIIVLGVEQRVFHCAVPERAARQLLALVNGYADDLLLEPSPAAAELALEEVLEVARVLLTPVEGRPGA